MRIKLLLVNVLVTAGLIAPVAPARAESYVDCSSSDYRRDFCGVDVRDGVRLDREYSRGMCREGDSWGVQTQPQAGIWVDRGCRARFRLGGVPNSSSGGGNNAAAIIGGLIIGGLIVGAMSHDRDDDRDRDRDRRPNRPPPGYPDRPPQGWLDSGLERCGDEAVRQAQRYGRRAWVDRILDKYPDGRGNFHVEGYVRVDTGQSPLMFNFYCDWNGREARLTLN